MVTISDGRIPGMAASLTACAPACLANASRSGLVAGIRALPGRASPRASIGLILSAKARAFLLGRNYVSKEDLHVMAYPVLRHRIILGFEAERKGLTRDQVVGDILKSLSL